MKKTAIAIFLLVSSIPLFAQDDEPKAATVENQVAKTEENPVKLSPSGEAHPPSIWMQQKLKQSQKIFAGMVVGDMISVEDAATSLKVINRLELFVRGRTRAYRTQLRGFQHANDEILEGAKENNLDRVTLGYNQLTISCVTCHKHLRKSDETKPAR